MIRLRSLWLLSALLLTACEGPAGQAGPPGPSPDGGLSVGCLSPCHPLQNGIKEQYRSSVHFAVYIANLGGEEATTWTTPGMPCGNCHAIDAIEQRVKGNVSTPGGGVANLAQGETNYRNTTNNKRAEALYAGDAHLAQVFCTTCHKLESDPHLTGKPYTRGTFSYWVPVGDNQPFLEKSPTAGPVTGQPAGKFGLGNVCSWCHKARPDLTNYITGETTLTSSFWGPHEGPQLDIYSGKGGYQFSGKSYTSTHPHQTIPDACTACHMPDVPENQGFPNHSFYPQLSVCVGCHAGATSFNINGQQDVVTKGLSELQAALNTAGLLTRGSSAPDNSQPLTAAQLADNQFGSDRVLVTSPPKVVPADVAGAIWNYMLVARGSGTGVHEPPYVKQLLWDSIEVVKGSTPTFIQSRP